MHSQPNSSATRDITLVFKVFAIILACILLGELWLTASYTVPSYYIAVRSVLVFIMAAVAFGVGRSSARFKPEWLIPILFIGIFLNLLFIIFKNALPIWLIDFYYPARATSEAIGFESVEDIIDLLRPRGLFGNPNVSMLMVNTTLLFIHLAIRNRILEIESGHIATGVIILPVILSALLGSRGEFMVALALGVLNYRLFGESNRSSLKKKVGYFFLFLTCLSFIIIMNLGENSSMQSNIDRIGQLADIFSKSEALEGGGSTIDRPLIQLQLFIDRFSYSPIFGAGISAAESESFREGTEYFHNDWFYMLAVTGLLGTWSLVFLLFLMVRRLGWPILLPFAVAGLTNTFILAIPAFIAYFLLLGICLAAMNRRKIGKNLL